MKQIVALVSIVVALSSCKSTNQEISTNQQKSKKESIVKLSNKDKTLAVLKSIVTTIPA